MTTTQVHGAEVQGAEVQGVEIVPSVLGRLDLGDGPGFLAGCTDDVSLTVYGIEPGASVVRGREVAAWFLGSAGTGGGRLTTALVSVTGRPGGALAHLVHTVERAGALRSWETVTLCTVGDGRIDTLVSYPVDLPALAAAWSDGPPTPGTGG